ncbi:hypothetical protein CB1_000462003 [Camelus ferus]|nr:hypothetical protein CB1_000462003 [Camelus ferus]
MAFSSPPDAPSPSALDVPACPRRRECTVPLAPTFTANNRCGSYRGHTAPPTRSSRGSRFVLFMAGPGALE